MFLLINKNFSKTEVRLLVEWFIVVFGVLRTVKLLDKLKFLGFNLSTEAGISLGFTDLLLSKDIFHNLDAGEVLQSKLKNKYISGKISKLEYNLKLSDCWNQVSESIKYDIINNIRETDLLNPLYMMLFSGARGNITQIKQLIGMRGLMVDSQGDVINVPVKSNLKIGLNSLEYFISCYGARKGIIDTAIKTANSGYLTRKLIYASENMFVKKSTCGTFNCQLVLVLNKNKKYYQKFKEELLGRVLAKDIKDLNYFILAGQDICAYLVRKLIKFKRVYVRSSLTCKLIEGVCQLCYGWNFSQGRLVELGENVGVVAAQSMSEPTTQLTMRTFHTGGIFSGGSVNAIRADTCGILYYKIDNEIKVLNFLDSERAFLTLKSKRLILVNDMKKHFVIQLPSCSIIYIKNGGKVFTKQIIAEISNWKVIKYSSSMNNFSKGRVKMDSNTNISGMVKSINEYLCVLHGNVLFLFSLIFVFSLSSIFQLPIFQLRNVLDFRACNVKVYECQLNLVSITFRCLIQFNNSNLKIKLLNFYSYNVMHVCHKLKKVFLNKKNGIKSVFVNNKFLAINFLSKNSELGNGYITSYSFQVFESLLYISKLINVNCYMLSNKVDASSKFDSLVSKSDKLFSSFFSQQKIADIVQGLPAIESLLENRPNFSKNDSISLQARLDNIYTSFSKLYSHKIAIRKSVYKIQKYLINKIKGVYLSQNITLSNKHIELVVRQMTSRVIVKDSGESGFFAGELVFLARLEKINSNLFSKVLYTPIILGISRLSMLSDSFLTAASFQQTFYTISIAALEGKCDWLNTLKGNIVVGNLIPVMTGYNIKKI